MPSSFDEFELIERYFAPLSSGEAGAFALTDDAAELAVTPGKHAVVTTDAIVAGVHFPASETPAFIASRLVRVNLSDLAAMGATPRAYTLAMALPDTTTTDWVAAFAQGLEKEQRTFGITLLGGDTTRSRGELMLCLTMIGEVDDKAIILRSGASVGDEVYVSGTIGDAMLGLALIEDRVTLTDEAARDFLIDRFRHPIPRVEVGIGLAGIASAAADISDGLVADLNHICRASSVSAEVGLPLIPLSSAARSLVTDDQPLHVNLLTGGDDYELVFTAPANVSGRLQELAKQCGVGLTRIGRIIDQGAQPSTVSVQDTNGRTVEVGDGGYRHFRRGNPR
ncbi:MAG: thiamine-phosphate kinase [Alphaproteobacteria bacterium]|nr:thiamine-phosphate kinase [Alphaproteobacteria bacterium]